jgi:hypothetical protein
MSFVDCYLPYFRQQLVIYPLSALQPFQSLFTGISCGEQLLALPPFSGVLRAPIPSAVCFFSVLCLLFSFVLFCFFCGMCVSLSRGLWWFIPGVAVRIWRVAYLLTCWTAFKAGLEPVSFSTGALLFSQFNVEWRSFVQAGDSGAGVLWFFLVIFFCHVWLQRLSNIFDLWSSCCVLLPSIHHLGSSPIQFFFLFLTC